MNIEIEVMNIEIEVINIEIEVINIETKVIDPLVRSVHYKGRLTKILILEGISKTIPMSVATMIR